MTMNSSSTGSTREHFGTMPDGREVEAFTLTSASGVEAQVLGYGGVLRSLRVPDRDGRLADVVLGYDSLDGYLADRSFHGALVGRFANRIRAGRFELDGRTYQLPVNNGPNHLHGGPGGFHTALWHARPVEGPEGPGVELSHTSPDGDQGYPGTLRATVVYTLTDAGELVVDYHATTDQATPVNLTQHAYFNLAGEGRGDVLGHQLTLYADAYVPVDDTAIPLGGVEPVRGTPFDFNDSHPIGARIQQPHPQLLVGGGYDHNFVLRGEPGSLRPAARVLEPGSGRVLEVLTTEPGVQFYSGNFLEGLPGKGGRPYPRRSGFCLETQHFPDSPNRPEFPSAILRPGEELRSRTVFRFGVE